MLCCGLAGGKGVFCTKNLVRNVCPVARRDRVGDIATRPIPALDCAEMLGPSCHRRRNGAMGGNLPAVEGVSKDDFHDGLDWVVGIK